MERRDVQFTVHELYKRNKKSFYCLGLWEFWGNRYIIILDNHIDKSNYVSKWIHRSCIPVRRTYVKIQDIEACC